MKKVKGLIIMLLISLSLFGMTACDGGNEKSSTYEQITAEQAKTIMDTERDYVIIDARTEEEFAKSAENGCIETMLNHVPVKKGDVFFIPPGTVHAIGKGILLAEIQQNSNITYRLYDYNRKQADGSLRQLHTQKALDVIKHRTAEEIRNLQFSIMPPSDHVLCSCPYFHVEKHEVNTSLNFESTEQSFLHLLVLNSDSASLSSKNRSYTLNKGESWFIPAGLGTVVISGKAEILISKLT